MLFWKKLNLLKMKQRISKKSLQSKERNMNNFRLVTARALEMVKCLVVNMKFPLTVSAVYW